MSEPNNSCRNGTSSRSLARRPCLEVLDEDRDLQACPGKSRSDASNRVRLFFRTSPRLLALFQDAPLGVRIGSIGKHTLVVQLRELSQLRYP